MTDSTLSDGHADRGCVLRPALAALALIAAGLGLLFWDNEPSNSPPSPLVELSQAR
jgi:hypothetical protein